MADDRKRTTGFLPAPDGSDTMVRVCGSSARVTASGALRYPRSIASETPVYMGDEHGRRVRPRDDVDGLKETDTDG